MVSKYDLEQRVSNLTAELSETRRNLNVICRLLEKVAPEVHDHYFSSRFIYETVSFESMQTDLKLVSTIIARENNYLVNYLEARNEAH